MRGQWRILLVVAASFLSAGSFWMFLPLLSMSLKSQGVSDAHAGLIAGLPWAGQLGVSVFIPGLIRRLGLQRMVLLGLGLAVAVYAGFAASMSVALWSGLCVLLGVSLALRWAGMDTWVNGAVPEAARGRLIGLYEFVLSGSMAVGPGMLALSGSTGRGPFVAACGVVLAAMGALMIAGRERGHAAEAPALKLHPWTLLKAAPAPFIGIALVGLTEACNLSLLPLFGLGEGENERVAALLVVLVQAGVAIGAALGGLLADKLDRRGLQLATAAAMVVLPLVVPVMFGRGAAWPEMFAWGLAQGALFTVGMVKLGAKFPAEALAAAMSLAMVVYTLGGIVGPPLLGGVMSACGPAGLIYGLCAIAVLGGAAIWRLGAGAGALLA
ncbi:MFS transporter [Acidocella sp.]|uniref:MFS transporter n=1 Tax=Acidocella sp. TaxID=50710 RepID=UPI00262ABCB1|nr:MFS transporter [Acidocella sp.]